MKKIYISLFSILMTATSYSQSLLNENFNYGSTAGFIGKSQVPATAWTGKTSAPFVGYSTTSLTMANYASPGVGGSATISAVNGDDPYILFTDQSTATAVTGEIYYSALVNISAATDPGDYFMSLRQSGASTLRARVYAKNNGTGGINFGISGGGLTTELTVYGTTAFSLNTTYLLSVYYNIGTGKVDLHILDTATHDVEALTSTGTGGQSLYAFALRQDPIGVSSSDGTTPVGGVPTATIDAVHVGRSWTDIGLPNLAEVASLSVKTIGVDGFKMYPNPTSTGYINIFSKSNTAFKVNVFDLIGKQVVNETVTDNRLNVSSLRSGVYVMKVIQDDATTTERLIIN